MTDRELEQRLAEAVNRAAPDDLEAILSRCGAQNGSVMELKPKKMMVRWLAAACAALVLVGGGSGVYYHQSCAVASVVSLDVNPSIELKVSRNEKVISCTALNEEAAVVLFSMNGGADLKGTKLDVAVNAIVGALVQAGYLDSISSAILISVEDNDQARAARLQQELVASVDGVLQTQAPGASILSQVLTTDAGAEPVVYGEGISLGKAALVQKVIDGNGMDASTFDQLAALSVEELNDLLETGETRIPIGKSAAAMAVETYAGTVALNSVTTDVDPELDKTPAYYEVELKTSKGKYEYIVDAFTGEVLSGQKDIVSGTQSPDDSAQTPGGGSTQPPGTTQTPGGSVQTPAPSGDIGQDAAKAAALGHAGLAESQVTGMKIDRDWDDGQLEYEVEFWSGNTEYEYTINGVTGAVLKYDREDHSAVTQPPAVQPPAQTYIGEQAACDAALSHAGHHREDTTYCNSWLSYDDGHPECYKVEFMVGSSRYEYEIGLYDSTVIKHECEVFSDHHSDDHHSDSHHDSSVNTTAVDIGQEAAKKAALDHAGVAESQTSKLKVKQDWDDGRLEYEVEFQSGSVEYEYTIDGSTGAVLEYEQDVDD